MSQARNDTKDNCDGVACFAFRSFSCAACPITSVAAFGIFRRRCPQYGQGILSPALGSSRAAGASVYSTLISIIEGRHAEFVKQTCSWPRDNASVESAAKD